MLSSEDESLVIAKQICSRRRAKTTSRTPLTTTAITAATVKNRSRLSPSLNHVLNRTSSLSTLSLPSLSPLSPLAATPTSPIIPLSMPNPTLVDSGDDDPYSDDDDMLWHRGGGVRRASTPSFASKRVNSATSFGSGGNRPYGIPNGSSNANLQVYSIQRGGASTSQVHDNVNEDPPDYPYQYDSSHVPKVGSSSYTSASPLAVNMSLRARIFSFAASPTSFSFANLVKGKGKARERERLISTKPGERGAGETETEVDEPPKHLPTARLVASGEPLIPQHMLQARLTPLLFEFSRLLSIVPACIGIIWCTWCIVHHEGEVALSTKTQDRPDRLDYIVSILWALLTGFQCLALTTGLLTRWRVYYPPLPTLIRLLALQAICWPATQFTMQLFDVTARPATTWAIVGTTTCMSRSVQIWVTSNLWWDTGSDNKKTDEGFCDDHGPRWRGGRWGGRRWDWNEVVWKCVLPAGVVYCVMAWVGELRRELDGY
ncbi:hypothetical protein E1B28_003144 [Marasmius oreades]|uniref:N-glycosylation protein EOS1 n=1 Tax=Marasmius oreades TaxID=181124 RepID=A0A9P7UK58_9AGAR|nr:uncharacterized protein E1B28_003144 [Marasmius oreades]KAG7085593.1 hypothetical protein E1B28_003144 [Marasmius oreades]